MTFHRFIILWAAVALGAAAGAAQQPIPGRSSGASSSSASASSSDQEMPEQHVYAWDASLPLGFRSPAPVDTLLLNYYLRSVPSDASLAWASTGNLGAEGINMVYMEREPVGTFFFRDALAHWLPRLGVQKFYNSRIPVTLLSYNTGGGKENTQDRLSAVFSGNASREIQVGAHFDYIYSKGSYAAQAVKAFSWGGNGSYMGERYELQAAFNAWNSLNKENGGISDDRYITDPAEMMQGGSVSIDARTIPTRLTAAHTRVTGAEMMMTHRYKLGFHRELPPDTIEEADGSKMPDTVPRREFVPVSAVTWAFDYRKGRHVFRNDDAAQGREFWENRYLLTDRTLDQTRYYSISNTIGLSLIEGFHKYAKFGLSAFITHELRHYKQTPDSVSDVRNPGDVNPALTPYPYPEQIAPDASENFVWVGGALSKTTGSILRYDATARFGLLGRAIGEVDIDGGLSTRIPLLGDTLTVAARGRFSNESAPYLLNNYVSNHFIWHNDFGKVRRVRLGGEIEYPRSRTRIGFDVENVQNLIYFDSLSTPVQHGGSVQVVSASLAQNFRVGILNWDNRLVWQKSSDKAVLPMPELAVYSNLYLLFKVATLNVQFGVDCDWYSSYYAYDYQPATATFHTQDKIKVGNYPFMNIYANMKLSKARFYVLFSHVNQGWLGGNNYFALPHYPMNPRRFQIGVSVDFTN